MMTLVKNILAIFGILTLALSALSDLNQVVALSKQISYVVNNWGALVADIWREICEQLGLPVIPWLAKPFSFLIGSLALALSAAATQVRARDTFFESLKTILSEEVVRPAPDATRAAKRIASQLHDKTRLSMYDDANKFVGDVKSKGRMYSSIALGSVLLISGFYATSGVLLIEGSNGFVTTLLVLNSWAFLYLLPFGVCLGLASRLGRLTWPSERGRQNFNDIKLFRDDYPAMAAALSKFKITMAGPDNPYYLQQVEEDASLCVDVKLFFDALEESVPDSFLERQVLILMAERMIASVLVILFIYLASYTIIIFETVGIL